MAKIREDIVGVVLALHEDGSAVILRPGDVVPDGVEVGAHVLAAPGEARPANVKLVGAGTLASYSDAVRAAAKPSLSPPPRSGKGSGAEAWRKYATNAAAAAGLNIDIPADAQRGDIIEALIEAQIRVE